MTANSEHSGYIRGYAANALDAGMSVDTGATRDAIVNNLTHLHDSHGQVLAALHFPAGGYALAGSGDPPTRSQRVTKLDCVFPLHVREDTGDSFDVVPYLWVEQIDTAGDVDVLLYLTPGASAPSWPPIYDAANVQMAKFTVTTGVAHAEEARAMRIPASVLRARSFDGLAFLSVWALWTATDAAAGIYVMNLREFIGA